MATSPPDESRRRRLLFLLFSVLISLFIALLGAYLVVVSQNSASSVSGPATSYGSTSE
jgi:hypothetical protein